MNSVKPALKLITVLVCLLAANIAFAESFDMPQAFLLEKVEAYGLGGIPWEEAHSADEERARAYMDALHHAYENVLSLQLMQGVLVKNSMQTNKALRERLGRVLLTAPKTFYQPDASGLLRCKITLPLYGKNSVKTALYLAALKPAPQEPLAFLASWSTLVGIANDAKAPDFKRVIIDMRRQDFVPSLFPRFFSETGMLIYQESMTAEPYRFTRPAILFSESITEAREGFEEGETLTLAAHLNPLSSCDITVEEADFNVFARFCKELAQKPIKERDIVIIFNPGRASKTGSMPQSTTEKDSEQKKK